MANRLTTCEPLYWVPSPHLSVATNITVVISNLPNSKWTAVKPVDRSKHFELKSLEHSGPKEDQSVCVLRCIVTKTTHRIRLEELKDNKKWRKGWY